jgi:hypothetical protein
MQRSGSTPSKPSTAKATTIPDCATGDLRTSIVDTGPAAGTEAGRIVFTNTANAPCVLAGWPALVGVQATGAASAARRLSFALGLRGPVAGAPRVVLASGDSAAAAFVASDVPGPGHSACPRPYTHLRIAPPGGSRFVTRSAFMPQLGAYLPACVELGVTMVVPPSAFAPHD